MRARYQRGYLRLGRRKTGPACWEFLWWDTEPIGGRVRRKAVIGTVQQYPNVEDAWQASNGLRVSINEARNYQREQAITVADLVDHYSQMELDGGLGGGGKSHATRIVYKDFLHRVGQACLGMSEHSSRAHYCRGTLASSTGVQRWQPDGTVNESENT